MVEADLKQKHELMAEDEFRFFRGTFYRWTQLWTKHCRDLASAPSVLAVGDLHVNSFGTWRDKIGRLVWGIDDFDEAYPLPYTNDLIRLATSARLAYSLGHLKIKTKDACDSIPWKVTSAHSKSAAGHWFWEIRTHGLLQLR